MIIYHSRGAYPARLAAAIHLGRLPPVPPADLGGALALLGGTGALTAEGLWTAGTDPQGRLVCALGGASRPPVVMRAFQSLAAVAGFAEGSVALRAVGRPVAWSDVQVRALRFVGLRGAAEGALLAGLRRAWAEAAVAVAGGDPTQSVASPRPHPPRAARNLIYFCYGGSHSSITAANIHLGRLPGHRRASPAEIIRQPRFDKAENDDLGTFIQMGDDESGHAIYVVGLAGGHRTLSRALTDTLALLGLPAGAFRFEPTLQSAGVILRIGGFTSRRLGWVAIGRPLCGLGVWLKYPLYAAHVAQVRRRLGLTGYPASDIIDKIRAPVRRE